VGRRAGPEPPKEGKKMRKHVQTGFIWLAILMLILSGCARAAESTETVQPTQSTQAAEPQGTPAGPRTLRVMTHDSFAISEDVLNQFQTENNATVQFIKSGDTGTALNKAILSRENPLADVFYGVDNTFLSRALEEDIFDAYESPQLANIPDDFELDPEHRALPVDYGDVCVNYDKNTLSQEGLEPPQTLDDLANPEYRGLLVVTNPATSSPGLAFLLATIGVYGPDGYLDYWQRLVENDVLVVNDWETAYYTEFSGSSGRGPRPLAVSYSSSPAFEVIYAETPIEEPPTGVMSGDNTCFRQIEFAGILKGGENRDLAEKWIDFMLSIPFQEDVPLQMFVFPVNEQAKLEETFVKFLPTPGETVQVDPQQIAENREQWLRDWTETVLR
jgi:thiamine transport system substrate-binding protein